MKFLSTISAVLGFSATVLAAPAADLEERASRVTVDTPSGTIVGRSIVGIEAFSGIPFADPPTGALRLRPPKKLSKKLGTFDATGPAPGCPQMYVSSQARDFIGGLLGDLLKIPFLQPITGQEDCLSVTVERPAGAKAGDKLPVLFWIFGGGFQLGATFTYEAADLMKAGIDQGQPFIFVAVNYRVAGFGFMPGAEILKDGSANLGLLDQRMGLEWVADNIAAFGGDPDKVTIWGESAGAMSVFDQMVLYDGDATYKGKPLFRGAIMNSGTVAPAERIDSPKAQAVYDQVVKKAGCQGKADTLNCLRELPYKQFLDAANSLPGILSKQSIALSYLPRPDGKVLTASPDDLAASGKYYAVPMIIGDQEDEGTLFSLMLNDLTSTERLVNWMSDYLFHGASKTQLRELVDTYDTFSSAGSPFRTGFFNQLYPGYKRVSAILGDLTFTLTRRLTIDTATRINPKVPVWSYLSSYNYGTPFLGTFHASDILQVFYGILPNNAMRSCRTYYFNFLYNLDPNKGVKKFANWPQWKENKELMWFKTGSTNDILKDDFRQETEQWITKNRDVLKV